MDLSLQPISYAPDVSIVGRTNGQLLSWDSTARKYVHVTISASNLGNSDLTSTANARVFNLNGNTTSNYLQFKSGAGTSLFKVNGDGSGGWDVDSKVIKFGSGSSISTGSGNTTTVLNGFGLYNCKFINDFDGGNQSFVALKHLNIGGSYSGNGTNTIEVVVGTAPTTRPPDGIKLYAYNVAGYDTSALAIKTGGGVINLFKGAALTAADATLATAITRIAELEARLQASGQIA